MSDVEAKATHNGREKGGRVDKEGISHTVHPQGVHPGREAAIEEEEGTAGRRGISWGLGEIEKKEASQDSIHSSSRIGNSSIL